MARTKLATTLRDARIRAALTQLDLAAELGVSHATVSHWENHSRIPGLRTLRRLTDLLELDWDEVLRQRADAEHARNNRSHRAGALETIAAVIV